MSEQPDAASEAADQGTRELPLEALGSAIRKAREAAGITVRGMAAILGCSPSHVSQVERGVTSPSVHTLFSMVAELGVSLDDLLAVAAASAPAAKAGRPGPWPEFVVRAADRRRIALPGGVKWEMLMPAVEDGFEFVEYVYEVGGSDGDDYFRRNGWEYGLVLEGRLAGAIGFTDVVLEAGDSIAYDSSAPHRFWNAGDVPARAVWVWHSPRTDAREAPDAHAPGTARAPSASGVRTPTDARFTGR